MQQQNALDLLIAAVKQPELTGSLSLSQAEEYAKQANEYKNNLFKTLIPEAAPPK